MIRVSAAVKKLWFLHDWVKRPRNFHNIVWQNTEGRYDLPEISLHYRLKLQLSLGLKITFLFRLFQNICHIVIVFLQLLRSIQFNSFPPLNDHDEAAQNLFVWRVVAAVATLRGTARWGRAEQGSTTSMVPSFLGQIYH